MDADIKEIKADVKTLLIQGAYHNELLRTHEARSLALQSSQEKLEVKIEPLQRHVELINALGKIVLAIMIGVVVHYVQKRYL